MSGHRRIGRRASGARLDLGTGRVPRMAHVASTALVRQLGALFDGGSAPGSPTANARAVVARATTPARPPSPPWSPGQRTDGPGRLRQLLGDRITPRTPSRPCSWWLARKARTLREPDLLGNWLYGVALGGRTGPEVPRPAGTASQGRGGRVRRACDGATRPAGVSGDPRSEQAEALHRGDSTACRALPLGGRALLLRGLSSDEAAHRLRMAAGNAPQPAGPGAGEAPARAALRGVALPGRAGGGAGAPVRPRRPSRPSCATPRPGPRPPSRPGTPRAGPSRQPPRPCPGGPPYHALSTSSGSPVVPLVLAAVATGIGFLTRSPAMGDERMKTPAGPEASPRHGTPTGPAGREARTRSGPDDS